MGKLEGNSSCSDNDWESLKRKGEPAIQNWIADQLLGRTCAVVLVGTETATRKWVIYEIREAWEGRKGVVGIRIHNLKDEDGRQSMAGPNPFEDFTLENGTKRFSSIVKLYDPPGSTSRDVYGHINDNLADWVEEAIEIRTNFQD
jgi:hypothetical protein